MADQPQYIAVDERGYLDVSLLHSGGGVDVYAPNASGNDQPVNHMALNASSLAATRGVVYIQTLDAGIEAVPEHSNAPPPVNFSGVPYQANGVATDATHLYDEASYYLRNGSSFLATAIYDLNQPAEPIRSVIGTGCRQSPSGGALGYGLAVYKRYVFQQCIVVGGEAGSVLVYDGTKSGRQAPLLEIPGGNGGVAIGP